MIYPTLDEFVERAKRHRRIYVWRDVLCDLDTPVSAYLKVARGAYSFLLESVEGGERVGRYSYIGTEPHSVISVKNNRVTVTTDGAEQCGELADGTDVLEPLAVELEGDLSPEDANMGPFYGGAVGYVAYDAVRGFEKLPSTHAVDDLGLPDAAYIVPSLLLIFDHVLHRVRVVATVRPGDNPEAAYKRAADKIGDACDLLTRPPMIPATVVGEMGNVLTSISKEEYCAKVLRAKEYIEAGDIFQVVLSQRMSAKVSVPPTQIYRSLRALNPSPYMYYLQFGGLHIVGSSPEVLVSKRGKQISTRPIAGTRHRGATPDEDAALADELLNDSKERAEHLMLVDLGRNDLGRVADFASVTVDQFMSVERYSHVMHLVSNIVGTERDGQGAMAVLRATFPAGTVSGAPKIRAMEIIDELEPTRRGPYAGAVGYFSYNGDMDAAICIRTIVIHNGMAHVQAGAGIVADSVPEREHQECRNKAEALLAAIRQAHKGLS